MIRRPPRSTRTDTLFPYTTLFRSVVSADKAPTVSAILAAGRTVGIQNLSNVYVRSSGTLEGIEERGSLESRTCALVDVPELVARLTADLAARGELRKQSVHFVVQRRVHVREKGHLSKERNLSRHPRDWPSEIAGSAGDRKGGV